MTIFACIAVSMNLCLPFPPSISNFQSSRATRNLQPSSTFNLQPPTHNLQPSTFNFQPSTPITLGIATLHNLMPEVLENYPERVQPDVDGYIALVDCSLINQHFTLSLRNQPSLTVSVADCMNPEDWTYSQYRRFCPDPLSLTASEVTPSTQLCPLTNQPPLPWLVDVEAALWSGPEVPQLAVLEPYTHQPTHAVSRSTREGQIPP